MHFKHEMIGKHFTETSNEVELRINRVRINPARPVLCYLRPWILSSNPQTEKNKQKQECIPVGCVPSATVDFVSGRQRDVKK